MDRVPEAAALVAALLAPAPRPLGALEAELLFYPGQYLFHYQDGAGDHYKLVTPATLRTAFSGEPVDSGWLAPGVQRWGEGNHGQFAVFWTPPAVHRLIIEWAEGATVQAVPLPGLVLVGVGPRYHIWATKTSVFDPLAPIYSPPLPNVYGDGSICWGANHPPSAAPQAMAGVLALFLGSPFNDHLAGSKSQAFPNDVRPQLTLLAAQAEDSPDTVPTYPLADLIACTLHSHPATVESAVQRLITPEVRT